MRYVMMIVGALTLGFVIGAAPASGRKGTDDTQFGSVNCIKECGGDPDCVACCRCIQAGGKPSHCCR
jgi:hypothetical protein